MNGRLYKEAISIQQSAVSQKDVHRKGREGRKGNPIWRVWKSAKFCKNERPSGDKQV